MVQLGFVELFNLLPHCLYRNRMLTSNDVVNIAEVHLLETLTD